MFHGAPRMVPNDRHYSDLPPEVRAYLETLDGEGVTNLVNMTDLYARLTLPRDKVSPLDFLLQAKPRTLEWLKDARPEDINQLDEAINLVRSSRTVGKFIRWLIYVTFGMFIVTSQFGDAITKLWHIVKGAGK
jgi:hypothetical protein